jgi:hypothetical protein
MPFIAEDFESALDQALGTQPKRAREAVRPVQETRKTATMAAIRNEGSSSPANASGWDSVPDTTYG